MDVTERRRRLDALKVCAEGNAPAMAALSRLLRGDDRKDEAVSLAARALELAPADAEVRAIAGQILSADVPGWHFHIVHDEARNRAYDDALRRAVKPGSRVLEIGTGTGLLAMMAARAGAAHVFTCEMEPAVALAARDVIARNGFADKVTVISKRSTDVDLAELGQLADVLVSETISNDMLTEDWLPSLTDAIARLVKPGGVVIPARGRVRVALAHDARMEQRQLGTISGFDLSPFNRLAGPRYPVAVGRPQVAIRSDAADLFDFDFQSGGPWPEQRNGVELRAHGGRINGILQWIALDMDEVGRYENQPEPATRSAWAALFHPFPAAIDGHAGQTCTVFGWHNRRTLRVWGKIAGDL